MKDDEPPATVLSAGAGILFGAAELSLHAWRAVTGAQLCHRAGAHTDKVPQLIPFSMARAPLPDWNADWQEG